MKINNNLIKILIILFGITSCSNNKATNENKVEEKEKSPQLVKLLVGTYTGGSSEGIYTLDFNLVDGSLQNSVLVAKSENPSYLAKSTDGNFVYAVNENNPGSISSFKWNDEKSHLITINKLPTEGRHPCFVELNDANNLLAAANYSSGNISLFKIDAYGSIQDFSQIRQNVGSGSSLPNQKEPHAHCSKFYKDKYLYVVDLGIDEVSSYTIDEDGGLGEKKIALKTDVSDGPRHLIFHPNKKVSYLINEISNSIIVSTIDDDGTINRFQKVSTLPSDFEGKSHCADIHISSNGKFLYASNRGHNSIAIFSVADDGSLTLLGTESVRGDWPRNFTLSKDGNFLLVANQKSDNITVFKIDIETGLLSFTGTDFKLSKPVCLKF